MSLTKYKAKRKFDVTPEPAGERAQGSGKLQFVVQKHNASHLHYDFRLEMEGVLKSWAVPKGPSLDPSVKRLAMQVEDHPFDYLRFEGHIPEGNYGAGDVIVWDIGTYWEEHATEKQPNEKQLLAGLKAGKLIINLKGKKLNGLFDMVRMKGQEGNSWLLFKKQDKFASTTDVTLKDNSAISRKRLVDPAGRGHNADAAPDKAGKPAAPASKPRAVKVTAAAKTAKAKSAGAKSEDGPATVKPANRSAASKSRKGSDTVPFPIKPMLTTLVDKPFDNEEWIFEVKWDGYRAIGQVAGQDVKLYSRNGNSFVDKYPTVVDALRTLGHDCVLDGEVVALGSGGKSGFQLLQNYGKTGKGKIRYAVFDLLFLGGHDLRQVPLIERKRLLKQLLTGKSETLVYGDHIASKGEKYFAVAEKLGLEGIIAKQASGPYRTGERSSDWLKIKTHQRQEAVIAGFTQPRGSRSAFGALILGVYDGAKLRYIGHTGTGFDERTLKDLHARLTPLITKTCPFKPEPKTNMPATWVKPKLLCEVQFTEWTTEGQMRHPVFVGLREDKPARQVKAEKEQPVEDVVNSKTAQSAKELKPTAAATPAKAASRVKAAKTTIAKPKVSKPAPARPAPAAGLPELSATKATLTHLDKPYWPDDGITKGQLLAYYGAVADYILPYLKDRPESLHRFPGGVGGQAFFQKDVNFKLPEFVDSAEVYSESNKEKLTWAVCQNRDALLYLVNLGCIEINPWNSRLQSLDKPDFTVLDLDPDGNDFDEVVGVALLAKKLLDKWGIDACCKTSGQTGLHIFIPLGAKYTYEQARQFTHVLARMVHAQTPGNTSLERTPAKRKGLIYLDYLQNSGGQTLAAPYSVRPAPGASVSTPLKWSEVRKGLRPEAFTIFNTLKRLAKVGDLWKPVLGPGIDLAGILSRMAGEVPEAEGVVKSAGG